MGWRESDSRPASFLTRAATVSTLSALGAGPPRRFEMMVNLSNLFPSTVCARYDTPHRRRGESVPVQTHQTTPFYSLSQGVTLRDGWKTPALTRTYS